MFVGFFYDLKELGVPVNPTAFITLHHALSKGLICNLTDLYTSSRCILIKNERYFDIFDQVFAYHFQGAELPTTKKNELGKIAKEMMEEWLKDPESLAKTMGLDSTSLNNMTPEELIEYFKKRLEEQTERHEGGSKWIGTGGTSPVGHTGNHPSGMRIGGSSRNKSAVKVAMERRYKDYNMTGPITQSMVGEALKKLRNLVPSGPKDQVNIDKSISLTMKNGGEIEICFDQKLRNKLRVMLLIDNGGWSMDPYVSIVQTLFHFSKSQFKKIKTFFFHNTIYETVWKDPQRYKKPVSINQLIKEEQDTKLIVVGDASMAPYEIMAKNGSIYVQNNKNNISSIECLKLLANTFPHSVWLNPIPAEMWNHTRTITTINQIFSMFEFSIDGLEKAVAQLLSK